MTLPIRRRARADADLAEAVDWYRSEAGADVALDFIAEVERTFAVIARMPGSGSLRIGAEVGIADLRSFAIARFPYAVFAMEREEHVEIWRLLHTARDLGALLGDESVIATEE